MKTQVITHNRVSGYHYWPDAPPEVTFLRNKHRHVFEIRCFLAVEDLDREREIFLEQERLKKYLRDVYGEEPCDFGAFSCEMIARDVMKAMNADSVEVLEDGFGGAKVTR